MLIEVFGSGCAKCETLVKHAKAAGEQSGKAFEVVKVSDFSVMAARGILSTPALAVDGKVKFQGKVASSAEILDLLQV